MSVVGFDLGYQSCHVAIVRHGGVEVIANEYSDRRSMSLVAFTPNRRLMGYSAKNQQIMNFKNTIYGFRDLLGRKFLDPCVQQEMKNLPFAIIGRKDGSIGIKVSNGEGEKVFSPEQITAMMLTYLKKMAEKALERPVVDCVISVPSFFTDVQRRALLDASTIAGLNCLRLFNEITAAALAYGIYKQDLPAETEKPRNIVFVDMGYTSLQVAVCSFQKGKLNVLARTFAPNLGGRNFDFVLVEYFVEEFIKKYKINVKGKPKQLLRLMGEVEKVKKMMSTVTTPIPLNIECFYEDRDVSSSIKRQVFEELCSNHFTRVRLTLSDALAKSKLSLNEIDAVEVIGGCCRVPAVKDAIVGVFKRELSTTLNLDEAVCRGCGLQCAMLSPTFKVREFSVSDIQPYPIQLKWKPVMDGDTGNMIVYKEGDHIYHSKMLTFYRKEPFQLEASYLCPEELPYPNPCIGTFFIKNVHPTEDGEASKIKVKVRMNIHGIFYVKNATLVEKQKHVAAPEPEVMEMDSVPAEVQLPDVDKMADKTCGNAVPDGEVPTVEVPTVEVPVAEEKMNDDPAQAEEESMEGTTAAANSENGKDGEEGMPNNDSNGSNGSNGDEKEKDVPAAKPPEPKKQKKPTVKYIDLPIVVQIASMSKKALDGAHEIEVNLNYQDQLEQEKADARNAVEEYVYSMRDQLYNLTDFVSEEDKTAFSQMLTATEDWLYDEGEDQPKKVYIERLTTLKKSGDPILTRERECQEGPVAFDDLGKMVVHYEKVLDSYGQGEELYAHLEAEEMGKVQDQVKTKREWLETQMQACQSTPKHVNAPVSSIQIRAEAKNLQVAVDPIVNKPKPKVEPPKDDQPTEQENSEAAAGSEETKMEDNTKPVEPNTDQPPPPSEDMDLD